MHTPIIDDPFPAGMVEDIEDFFSRESIRQPGYDIYDDVFERPLMFPLQRQRELSEMMRTARAINPKIVMEIGADKGGGLYHWCKCLPTVTKVIACEIRGTPYSHLFEKHFPNIEFLWLPQSSRDSEAIKAVTKFIEPYPIDCLFIDGDKSAFLDDFFTYRHLMNDAGLVFMHDVTDSPGPKDAFDMLIARKYHNRLIHDISDAVLACTQADMGLPAKTAHDAWLRHWRGRSCGVGVIYLDGGGK